MLFRSTTHHLQRDITHRPQSGIILHPLQRDTTHRHQRRLVGHLAGYSTNSRRGVSDRHHLRCQGLRQHLQSKLDRASNSSLWRRVQGLSLPSRYREHPPYSERVRRAVAAPAPSLRRTTSGAPSTSSRAWSRRDSGGRRSSTRNIAPERGRVRRRRSALRRVRVRSA